MLSPVVALGFLLYSPLNQGLKPDGTFTLSGKLSLFLLYSPLNQGLKPQGEINNASATQSFYSTVH